MIFGRGRNMDREWARLREAEARHGKGSREYLKALSRWVRCLRAEAGAATRRAYDEIERMREARDLADEAKARHGAGSKEHEGALEKCRRAEAGANEARRTLELIQRAALSIDV